MSEWRFFKLREQREAILFADTGGIAVHETGRPYGKWKFTAHLFAQNEEALRDAAVSLGLKTEWFQHHAMRIHFDIFGQPLVIALGRCNNEAAFARAFRDCQRASRASAALREKGAEK